MSKSPVLFLIFNRPDPTMLVFETIRKYQPEKLYIAADGGREQKQGEKEKCLKLRNEIINKIDWDCEIHTLFRENNLGCKVAVSSGIDWFFSNEEMGIILEDDCLPNQSFFYFCDELLEKYRDDERVMQIGGNNFQFGKKWGSASYYFSKYNHIWGWASWRRAWDHNSLETTQYEDFIKSNQINYMFKDKNERRFWLDHFNNVYLKKVDTWDAQWTLSFWMQNGLCVLPALNLVTNIGFNMDALHTKDSEHILSNLETEEFSTKLIHPDYFINNFEADTYAFNKIFKPSLIHRIKTSFKS